MSDSWESEVPIGRMDSVSSKPCEDRQVIDSECGNTARAVTAQSGRMSIAPSRCHFVNVVTRVSPIGRPDLDRRVDNLDRP